MMNSKTVRAVGIVVSVVAGIFVLACGQAVEKEVGEDEHANSRADLLAHQWSEREVAGLFVLTPSAFREQQLQLPSDAETVVGEAVDEIRTFRTEAGPVEVSVSRFVYKTGTVLSLEGAVEGAAARMSQASGVSGYEHVNTFTLVSGISGIRTSASFYIGSRSGRAESLTIVVEQTLWLVQAVFTSSESAASIAERILSSVRFEGGARA